MTHPVAAFEALNRPADEDEDGGVLEAAVVPGSAFHAGLSSLQQTGFYSRLPPALLPPEAGGTAAVASPGSAATAAQEEHGEEEREKLARASAASSASAPLIPFPALQPLLPSFSHPSFVWQAWVESLGHRLYALLWRRAPRLANLIRRAVAWGWERREVAFVIVGVYVAFRMLTMLARYFRLAHLPGVSLLLDEMRNFIRVAFISGTGRSLFA